MKNPLKQKLKQGQPIIGLWSLIPSPNVVEMLSLGGFDFLILDMEHGLYDLSALDSCIRACETGGASPLVRIPGLNASAAQWALDSGAHGIVIPQIQGEQGAREALALCKFPPAGTRGYNPFVRAGTYSGNTSASGTILNNDFTFTSVIVENKASIDALEAICALPHLDMIYIGVYDLSVALDCGGNVNHPRIREIVASSVKKIRASGKAAGMMVRDQTDMEHALKLGANVLLCMVDSYLIRNAAKAQVMQFRAAQGGDA